MSARTFGALAIDTAADWLAGKKPKTHDVENPTVEIAHANVNKRSPADVELQ